MDAHRCKLCFKSFANGKALGGHMRSHMMNLYVPPKHQQQQQPIDEDDRLGEEAESASFSSSSSSEEEENEDTGLLLRHGWRENPKKCSPWVDPKFNLASDAGSVVLQDKESETENSKHLIRRRSKRIRKSGISHPHSFLNHHHHQFHSQTAKEPEPKKPKSGSKLGNPEPSWAEPEPVSSISETSPEENIAYCLMMLSRDKWMRGTDGVKPEPAEEYDQSEEEYHEHEELKCNKAARVRGKYRCETCHRVFRSYQALGGHRASHKKNGTNNQNCVPNSSARQQSEPVKRNAGGSDEKVHQCPVCYRVFSSGQALGGHKRSHVIGSTTSAIAAHQISKSDEILLDLNLPAPVDDEDEISQVELSVVSDGEFVNPVIH